MTISLMDYDFGFWNTDDVHTVLAKDVKNTGEAVVTLPKNGVRLDDRYYFRIQWNKDKRIEGLTKNIKFTRKEGSITVTAPKKGAKLIPHQQVDIEWTTSANIPVDAVLDFHLYESRNAFVSLFADDKKFLEIGTAANAPGKLSWKVPDLTPSDDYYIKAIWTEYKSVDVDSAEFEIVQGVVSVKPFAVDKSSYVHNEAIEITWDYVGLTPEEKVDLSLLQYDQPGSFWDVINVFNVPTGRATIKKGVALGDKKFVYTIPKNLPASNHYVVQLQVQGKTGIKGTSADACDEKSAQAKKCAEWVAVRNHAGKVTVTKPNAKSAPLRFGDDFAITWETSSDIPATAVMEIQLYEDRWWPFNDKKKVVIKDVPNTGSYTWTAPSTGLDEGDDYYFSVTWLDHPTVTDESDKFAIFKEFIRLTQATLAGTVEDGSGRIRVVQEGKTHKIEWAQKGIPDDDTVSIELFNDGFLFFDSSVKHIAKGIKVSGPTGSFDWVVPTNLKGGDDYYVRISWDKNDKVFDESRSFTLRGHPGTITVKEPSADKSTILWITTDKSKKFVAGKPMDITWNTADVPDGADVSIAVYLDRSFLDPLQVFTSDFKLVVSEGTPNDGAYTWTVPGGLKKTDGYYVVVQYVGYPSVLGESAEFEVVKGKVTVDDPTKAAAVAESFLAEGESYTVTWKMEGPSADEKVTIRLMDDDFWTADDEHALIAKGVKNTGSYEWKLPNNLPVPDKNFYVTVECTRNKTNGAI